MYVLCLLSALTVKILWHLRSISLLLSNSCIYSAMWEKFIHPGTYNSSVTSLTCLHCYNNHTVLNARLYSVHPIGGKGRCDTRCDPEAHHTLASKSTGDRIILALKLKGQSQSHRSNQWRHKMDISPTKNLNKKMTLFWNRVQLAERWYI